MSTPSDPGGTPLFDVGNTQLSTTLAAQLVIGKAPAEDGTEHGFATIRQGNTTLSIPLDRDGAELWSRVFGQLRDMLSSSGLAVQTAPKALVTGHRGQRT